jgi:RND family efflux transporter MFP subunit
MRIAHYKKPIMLVCIVVVLALVGGFAANKWHKLRAVPKAKPVQSVRVIVSTAHMASIPKVVAAFGIMESIKHVNLSFDLDGRIMKILAKNGQRVKKGDVIAEQDNASALAKVKSDTAGLQVAKSNYERMKSITAYGGISKQTIEEAKAHMVEAGAQLEQDQVTLAKKKLKAPFSGVLGIFTYHEGAYLVAGTGLITLVQQAPLKVKYSVPAALKPQLEIGQKVTVSERENAKQNFTGIVSYISPQVDSGSGTLTLEAKVPNPDFTLSPGMFVQVSEVIDPNQKLLVVPDEALMTDVNGQYVFVVQPGNVVKKTYVTTGEPTHDLVEILKGLKAGQRIVTVGQQRLYDGGHISVIPSSLPKQAAKAKPSKVKATQATVKPAKATSK